MTPNEGLKTQDLSVFEPGKMILLNQGGFPFLLVIFGQKSATDGNFMKIQH